MAKLQAVVKQAVKTGTMMLKRAPVSKGFDLVKFTTQHFRDFDKFQVSLGQQRDATALLDAGDMRWVELDGTVAGTNWRLSAAAFNDLCSFCAIPVSFIKRLALYAPQVAQEVIEAALRSVFHRAATRHTLVLDSRDHLVQGIVGSGTYTPIHNVQMFEYVMSSTAKLKLTNGWLTGPDIRFTALTDKAAEPMLGDVVRFGVDVLNGVGGDRAVVLTDYAERQVCTNGMLRRDRAHTMPIIHRGDVDTKVQSAIVATIGRQSDMEALMAAAASHKLADTERAKVESFLTTQTKLGGSDTLMHHVMEKAVQEAQQEGRDPNDLTLWNVVNGVTVLTHAAPNLKRRSDLEALGWHTLARFGMPLLSN